MAETQAGRRLTPVPIQPTGISLGVTLAVLGAGMLHAGWNMLLKSAPGGDPLLDTAGVVAASSFWSLLALPFVAIPAAGAWPFIAASATIHFAYYLTLTGAYRTGDLSFAYPLMRGTAPLLVALLGIALLHEWPTLQAAAGIALISAGIISIAFVHPGRHPRAAVHWALANAAIIACYTFVDGTGARASGDAWGYAFWLMFLEGFPFLFWIAVRRGRPALPYMTGGTRRSLATGAGSVMAYAIVLWAMTRAPVALVAALRETSVVFATLFGALILKEGLGWRRLAGATSVALGVAALKL